MKEQIELLIKKYEQNIAEIEEWCGEDFNAMDASGGNFDDAYQLGWDHGYESGKLTALRNIHDAFFK